MELIVLGVLALTNGLCFCLMGIDKRAAQSRKRRIPEKTLFLSAALFGALGGVMGMRHFHHKTRHASFRVLFPLLLVLQCAALAAGAWLWLKG